MKVLSVGMMVCDIPLAVIPKGILGMDKWEITPPVAATGGDALNVAAALSILGTDAALIGRIGKDLNGDVVLSQVREKGVDIKNVIRDERYPTAVSYLLIDEDGERHALSTTEIYGALTDDDVPDEAIGEADLVYFGSAFLLRRMDEGGTLRLFERAHRMGKTTAMDTAMVDVAENGEQMLERISPCLCETDIFLPSYEEARYLTGRTKPKEIAREFEKFHFKQFGIKLGSEGCYVTDYSEEYRLLAFGDFPVRDTTGAGDSFMAGFLCGFLHGYELYGCTQLALAVAGHNIAKVGATAGVPSLETALSFLRGKGIEL